MLAWVICPCLRIFLLQLNFLLQLLFLSLLLAVLVGWLLGPVPHDLVCKEKDLSLNPFDLDTLH